MESLPNEILEKIFRDENLDYEDLSRLAIVCKRLHEIIETDDIWMEKFKLAFPKLFKQIFTQKHGKHVWKQELRKKVSLIKDIHQHVEDLSEKTFLKTELSKSDYNSFDDILLQQNHGKSNVHLYVLDELTSILNKGSCHDNLTNKFYATKCLQHVRHSLLKPELLKQRDEEEAGEGSLHLQYEKVMTIIASWSQPTQDISDRTVSDTIDSLATKALQHLHQLHPKHPIFNHTGKEGPEHFPHQLPNYTNLRKTLWTPSESKQVLSSTNHILYEVEEFSGNKEDYYNPHNSWINMVFETKQGIPITLSILYTCLVARLGVVVHPINFPGHFMLKWLEHPSEQEERSKYTYIDAFAGGKMLTEFQARDLVPHLVFHDETYNVAAPAEVGQRMLRNLISIGASRNNSFLRDNCYGLLRSSLELMIEWYGTGGEFGFMEYGFMLSRVYLQLNINHEDVMNMLQDYRDLPGIGDQVDYLMNACQLQMDDIRGREEKPEPKMRGVAASFPCGVVENHIGQVCKHRKYNYICVIFGWDPKCTASTSWIKQMGVDKLENKNLQPFYNVLVSDGSNRYAAQENLEPIPHQEVTHPDIGKYFEKFDMELGYVANKQLRDQYPNDRKSSTFSSP